MAIDEMTSSKNQLLQLFSDEDLANLLSKCELVQLEFNEVLIKPNCEIEYIYFPIESIISWLQPLDKQVGLVVALIGNEGMLSISPLLGVNTTYCQAVVQKAGSALRISVTHLISMFETQQALNNILRRYIFVVLSQVMQMAGCVRFHLIEQRLARIILMIKDRANSTEYQITQKSLANMLGVRRVSISEAAAVLQRKNLISYNRGHVNIHDISGLEALTCNCYNKDKEIYQKLLNAIPNILTD